MLLSGEIEKQNNNEKDDLTIDRLASVGQIAAGIAHEVRNPLTAVKGFLQLLQKESPHKYLDIAFEELEHALTTMQNLLNVSKPDLDDETYSRMNLCTELESILYLFQDQIYRVQVKKDFRDTYATIYGKQNQIKKAFFNLIKNAFEAIEGEGSITIKHYLRKDVLVVSIADTGEGIPKEKKALLGSPFFTSKTNGTGMGLTQVFSTIYDHNGKIEVNSEPQVGTEFIITFPIQETSHIGVVKLANLVYTENQGVKEFFNKNIEEFDRRLINQGKSLFDNLGDSKEINEEYILESSHKVVQLLNEGDQYGLIMHGKEHGKNWAKNNLELILKLEWIQTLRNVYWEFLFNFYDCASLDKQEFFEIERKVNFSLDSYMNHFSSSFSEYKNQLLLSQNELIDNLNVPIISITDSMAILPIVGMVDTRRAKRIQESVLSQIYQMQLKQIIIDLSGVAFLDTAVLGHLFKIVNGVKIQGCKAILTGIRPEITNAIVELGVDLNDKVETMGTLKQAIEVYSHLK